MVALNRWTNKLCFLVVHRVSFVKCIVFKNSFFFFNLQEQFKGLKGWIAWKKKKRNGGHFSRRWRKQIAPTVGDKQIATIYRLIQVRSASPWLIIPNRVRLLSSLVNRICNLLHDYLSRWVTVNAWDTLLPEIRCLQFMFKCFYA